MIRRDDDRFVLTRNFYGLDQGLLHCDSLSQRFLPIRVDDL